MSTQRLLVVAIAVVAGLWLLEAAPLTPPVPPKAPVGNEIIQEFPTNDQMRTAWKVHWMLSKGYGLYIQDAWLKKGPNEPWVQVLGDLRLAEMFVPYHSGTPRFWDISYNFDVMTVGRDEAGAFGKVLGSPPQVVAELRDRGLFWMDTPKGTRRGQSLVLWASIDAGNYRYITEFGFQDDGTITSRVGATGRNYASREFEGHMHNGLWRVDLNVGGAEHNSVFVMEHLEPEGETKEQQAKARTLSRPFNEGIEGYYDWNAERFSMLSVLNTQLKNARGKPLAYDIVTGRMGNARHAGPDEEECTQHDFWVTRNRSGEIFYKKLPQYIKRREPILDTDVVVWVSTACHHEPRSEDGELKGSTFTGATPIAWSGFELKPRNFFDRTPHYNYAPPPKKGNNPPAPPKK
jgi:primary-amine oxidase